MRSEDEEKFRLWHDYRWASMKTTEEKLEDETNIVRYWQFRRHFLESESYIERPAIIRDGVSSKILVSDSIRTRPRDSALNFSR